MIPMKGCACAALIINAAAFVAAHDVVRYPSSNVHGFTPCPRPVEGKCGRAVIDDFLSREEVSAMHEIASRGMAGASENFGPLIMDINTGFTFGASGLRNMYTAVESARVAFADEQYALYRRVVTRVQAAVASQFDASILLTAPTFLTRIRGSLDWEPASEHDKYFHYHVDKNNTAHYDYSGLVYLSTVGSPADVADSAADFVGGVFDFNDDPASQRLAPTHDAFDEGLRAAFTGEDVVELDQLPSSHPAVSNMTYVLPRAGRLVIFSAGEENLHRVARVQAGTRLTLSLWFTLDPKFQFEYFLDGKPHEQVLTAAKAKAKNGRSKNRRAKNSRRRHQGSASRSEL